MLFMQRKPALSSLHLAPDHGYTERSWNHTPPRASTSIADCRNQQLATALLISSSSALLRSPATSTSEVLSSVIISPGEDDSNQYARTWPFDTRPNRTPTGTVDALNFSSESPLQNNSLELSPTSSHSSQSYSFAVVSSPDTDMTADEVTPKVEEIEDEAAVSLEGINQQDKDTDLQTCSAETTARNVIEGPRKRGRPRKHPLPTPGLAKVAKGRSKTGCITCRRRKKKCDETKPSCLNCQKNAVVCEGYPMKEIWKSGKQKMEEGTHLILYIQKSGHL